MFAFCLTGVNRFSMRAVKPAFAVSLALAAGACSSKAPQGPQVFAWMLAEPKPAPVRTVAAAPVELEDDGLPAQTAPSYRIRQSPDDPTAPWSRNYGGPAPIMVKNAEKAPPMGAGAAWGQDDAGGDVPNAPMATEAGDDGLPAVMGPDEAGIPLPPPDTRRQQRGASLTLPSARCARSGNSWICTR